MVIGQLSILLSPLYSTLNTSGNFQLLKHNLTDYLKWLWIRLSAPPLTFASKPNSAPLILPTLVNKIKKFLNCQENFLPVPFMRKIFKRVSILLPKYFRCLPLKFSHLLYLHKKSSPLNYTRRCTTDINTSRRRRSKNWHHACAIRKCSLTENTVKPHSWVQRFR